MSHLWAAHLQHPSHSCRAGKANKTAVTQAWRVLGIRGREARLSNRCNPRKKIISLYAFHSIWWQNGLWLSHCLKAIPQIPCLLSAGWVVDSVTLAVNGPKHFCQQIKLCWNVKENWPKQRYGGFLFSCCFICMRIIVCRQWHLPITQSVGNWVKLIQFLLNGRNCLFICF